MLASPKLVALHATYRSQRELFEDLGGRAHDLGLVGEGYLPALLAREEAFPTGLELPVPIAIPHIDTGVNRSFVSVATLDEPLAFRNMDLSGDELEVGIVFVFGIVDPADQLEILKRFARVFPQEDRIRAFLDAPDEQALVNELDRVLEGMLERA